MTQGPACEPNKPMALPTVSSLPDVDPPDKLRRQAVGRM